MTHFGSSHFQLIENIQGTIIQSYYNFPLVVASLFTAVFAAYVSFLLSARIHASQLNEERKWWIILSTFFLGIGIWGMHFIGMLAYRLPIEVSYNLPITLLSIIPSVLASYFVISTGLKRFKNLFIRSLCMGAGIGSMHYVGMFAMQMNARMTYDPRWFALSIVVAVVLAGIALKMKENQQQGKSTFRDVRAAVVMGLAIAGMHYTGMVAMVVVETPQTVYGVSQTNTDLAKIIFAMLVIASVVLFASLELRRRSLVSAQMEAVLNTVQDSVISFNRDGKIEFANPATLSMFGFKKNELLQTNICSLFAFDHAKINALSGSNLPEGEALAQMLNDDVRADRTYFGRRKVGERFPISVKVEAIRNSDRNLFVSTIRDLTDLQNQTAFMQTTIDTIPVMVFVKYADDLTIKLINKAGEKIIGMSRDELLGKSDADLFEKEQAEHFMQVDRKVLASDEMHLIEKDPVMYLGKMRYFRTRKVAIRDPQGTAKFLLGVSEDVTEFYAAKEQLEQLNQRFVFATNAAEIGVWEWDLDTKALIWDERMFQIFDQDKASFNGEFSCWANCLHPDDAEQAVGAVEKAVEDQQDLHFTFRIITRDNKVRYIQGDGKIYGKRLIGINMDITGRVEAEQEMQRLAQTDHLTGLANRTALIKFLKVEMARANRHNTQVVCLYFDLNKFKPINDTYGHKMGDLVLQKVAKRFTDVSRELDCVARIGGDEFVVILTDIELDADIQAIAQRYIDVIEKPISTEVGELLIGTSVGHAIYPSESTSLDGLLTIADERMYQQKQCETYER